MCNNYHISYLFVYLFIIYRLFWGPIQGYCYERGTGVDQSFTEAAKWYSHLLLILCSRYIDIIYIELNIDINIYMIIIMLMWK